MRPPTLASEMKFESHSASSPWPRAGISAGGLAGSNKRRKKTTGCFSMIGAAGAGGLAGEIARHASQPAKTDRTKAQISQICRKEINAPLPFSESNQGAR